MGTPNSRIRTNVWQPWRPVNLLRPASDVSFADDTASQDNSSFSASAVVDSKAAAQQRSAGSRSGSGSRSQLGTALDHSLAVCFADSESLNDVVAETSPLVRSLQQPVVIVTPPGGDIDGNVEAHVEAAAAPTQPPSSSPPTPPRFRRRNSVSLPAGLNAIMEPPEYELRLTPELTQADGYDTSDTFSDVMTDDEENIGTDTKPTAGVENRRLAMPLRSPGPGHPTSNQQIVAEDCLRPHRNSLRAPSPAPVPTATKNGKGAVNHEQDGDDLLLELGLHTEPSPGNSITSMTSISSLLKEKLALTLPAMLKKYRKPKEYKLRGFVMMLFLSIVFLVGFAHVFYNHQVLQFDKWCVDERAYLDLIRLNKHERVVRILSAEGAELVKGELGTLIGQEEKPYACLARDERHDGSVCLEWMHQARLYLHYERHDKVHCYRMTWTSLDERVHPTDCYDLTAGGSNWYGGGRPSDMRWPMGSGKVGFAPFLTGDSVSGRHHWGNVLRRYFISSKGVAITIDPATPLYVSVDDQICFQARHDDFAYVRQPGVPAVLNYSLCTMDTMNMTELHRQLSEKSLWDGLKDTDVEVIYKLLTEPVWQITPQVADGLSETAILNYTEDVISLGFFRQGHILLNELWQTNLGDLAMDEDRFPTMEETINIVHRRGFKVALTIQPFIGTESTNFVDAVRQQLFVGSRGSGEYVPALTRYKSLLSAGALDLTNPESAPWLQEKLKDLVRRYDMDGFFLDMGVAYDLPLYYQFENRLTNPDHYKAKFTEAVQSVVTVVGVSSAIKRPRPPTFVTLPAVPSSWKGLQSIIPTILTYGMIGYPFVMPGAIGGDFVNATLVEPLDGPRLDTNRTSSSTTTTPSSSATTDDPAIQAVLSAQSSVGEEQLQQVEVLEDAELYLRWQQLATFLPVIRYTHPPNKYGNAQVLENARMLTTLRQKTINPVLRKYTREALDLGLPIVRPLWMLDSQDPACRVVADEFSIGDDIIVAPVLKPGSVEREVYLPTGVWKDGIDGSLRKGNRWIHMYKVPVDKIAYFVKMPDNTRF